MDPALETLRTAVPAGVPLVRMPAAVPAGSARAVLWEGIPDLAELRRVSAPEAIWILLVPNGQRVAGGATYETIEGWVADRPHRLYSHAVLCDRRNLEDEHSPLVVRMDPTICVLRR